MQFSLIIDTLKHGEVVFVIDFSRNFAHVFQDEPQSAHWDRMQSTMHPCVAYYKCKCDSTMMDEMIHFSPNLKHDTHAVDAFEQTTIEHLKVQNVDISASMNSQITVAHNISPRHHSKSYHGPIYLSFTIFSVENMESVWQMELLEEQTNLFIVKSKPKRKTYQILKYLPNSALRSWKYLLKMVNVNITKGISSTFLKLIGKVTQRPKLQVTELLTQFICMKEILVQYVLCDLLCILQEE